MKRFVINSVIAVFLLAVISAVSYHYLSSAGSFRLKDRLPGGDLRPKNSAGSNDQGPELGSLQTFDGSASQIKDQWVCFRGQNHDNIAVNQPEVLTEWPQSGPKTLWQIKLGEGYSGPVVHDGKVYLIDYEQDNLADAVRCLSLDDGAEIWRYSYPVKIKRNHGMSRTVPAVTEDYLVTIGPKCHVACLDPQSGELLWSIDLVKDFGTKIPLWYAGQCPIIVDGKAIIAPAGSAMIIAVDCKTGKVIWQTPNPDSWQMTHSSILPMTFAGRKMFVYCASGGVIGVDAETGEKLWATDKWKMRTNVPSPVAVGGDKIFLSAGYGKGAMMLGLKNDNGMIIPEVLFELAPKIFGAEQHTPIYYKNHIFGIRPDRQMVCMDTDGNVVWQSGDTNKFGIGPFILVKADNGEFFYIMDDHGTLTMAKAQTKGYEQLAQVKVLDGHDSWAPMSLTGARLIVRDLTTMKCLQLDNPKNAD